MIVHDFYKQMLDNIYEGIYFVDTERRITFWNKGAERITGFLAEEVVGRYCYDNILNHVDGQGNRLCFGGCPLHKTIEDGLMRDSLVYLHHKEGHRVTVNVRVTPLIEDGVTRGAIEIFVDSQGWSIEELSKEELMTIASRDQLTNLPNRRCIDHELVQRIDFANRFDEQLGIAFIDIDHFKKINDLYGHLVGDQVLKMVARTLKTAVRNADVVGRWGGEEFIAILPGVDDVALKMLGEKMRMLVENSSIREQDESVSVTVSMGLTVYRNKESTDAFIQRADKLLYTSKNNGRNQISVG